MSKKTYLDATQKAGQEFFMRQIKGPVVMLNLLKYRQTAEYPADHPLAPGASISGEEAYQLYIRHTLPFLQKAGSEIIFYGKGGAFLIGPEAEEEEWDMALLVKHASVQKFMEFAVTKEYLLGVVHRTAALEDSRLLPIVEESLLV